MRWFCNSEGKIQTVESLEPGTYRIQEHQLQDYEGNTWTVVDFLGERDADENQEILDSYVVHTDPLHLWLDDVRPAPEGYDFWAFTAQQALDVLQTGCVGHVSLDHDLGDSDETGYTVACWIEDAVGTQRIPSLTWQVHSSNPVGRKRIEQALRNLKPW